MTLAIIVVVLTLILLFTVPLLVHFIMRTTELENQLESMQCRNCQYCAERVFHTESGTIVLHQCYQRGQWVDTEPQKVCERFKMTDT